MEYKDVQNIIVFLSEYGITVNLALKIYEIYKHDTIPQVQRNPYALVEQVSGIGFLTADRIAANFGIEKNSKFRIRAGALYTLTQASERNGHTFLPYEDLLKQLSSLLGIVEEELTEPFDDILATLSNEGQIVETSKKGMAIVALKKFYNQESSVAKKLSYLNHNSFEKTTDFSKDIELFENLKSIVERDPSNFQAKRELAILCLDMGFEKNALNHLSSLAQIFPEDFPPTVPERPDRPREWGRSFYPADLCLFPRDCRDRNHSKVRDKGS